MLDTFINEVDDTSLNLDQSVDHTDNTSHADQHCFTTNINSPTSLDISPDQPSIDDVDEDDGIYDVSYHIPVPKVTAPELPDNMTPITIMLAKTIGLCASSRLLRVLVDSGTTTTMIHSVCYLVTFN